MDHHASPAAHPAPVVGRLAHDTRLDRVGLVMEVTRKHVWLRPAYGGREWEADRSVVRGMSPREELSARLAAANAETRRKPR